MLSDNYRTCRAWRYVGLVVAATVGAGGAGAYAAQESAPAAGGGAAAGRPVVSKAITVQDAVEIALKESPVVRGAEDEVDAAIAETGMARAATRPALSATAVLSGGGVGGTYITPSPVMPPDVMRAPGGSFFGQNLSLMVPLYTGGRLQALVRQAQSARQASGAELGAVRNDLALEVKTAYRQVLLAQSVAGIYKNLRDTAQERLRIDQAALDAGRIPKFYVLRDEAEAADAEQLLVNAQRDVDVALILLKTGMGVSQDSQITLADQLSYEPFTQGKAELLALAMKQRPELQAAEQRVEAARQGIAVARSTYQPQVSVGAMVDGMVGKGSSWDSGIAAGVVVGLPILDGGMRRAQVGQAQAGTARAGEAREQVALQVTQDVESGYVSLQAAEKNIKTAQTALASAEENYRVAQLRYSEGRGINVEVLDALTAYTRAQTNYAQALFDYSTARDRLLRAAGER